MNRRSHITLVNGVETSALTIADRGLAYGDGLFETMRIVAGKIPLLKFHIERFERGVHCLKLGAPKALRREFTKTVEQVLSQLAGNNLTDNALVKIMVTRGCGGMGYLPPDKTECTFICQAFNLPEYPSEYSNKGIQAKIIAHRLPLHPALAGIKHLNRLDQVLASQELHGEQEGLVFDQNDHLIEGLKSNVLVFEGHKVLTPSLENCGVQGTLRQYLMGHAKELGFLIEVGEIDKERLKSADGVSMINSVFGLWPILTIRDSEGEHHKFERHNKCKTIQQFINKQLGF
ncbi:MAG: 4-amino-4-deoxychorismate lyase [Pseudohongiellaceae bacterium]